MTSSSSVRSAWNSAIWTSSSVTVLTDKIYSYDVVPQSKKELSLLRFNQEFNFFVYIVTRAQKLRPMNQTQQIFTVEVRYYRQANVDGSNFNACNDNLETVEGLIQGNLGTTWSSTIDFYQFQEGPTEITQTEIEGLPVWLGVRRYFGTKNI